MSVKRSSGKSFLILAFLLLIFSCKETQVMDGNHILSSTPGLHVTSGGELERNGKPYRGVGVNYFSAFYRILLSPSAMDTSYKAGFRYLRSQGIPFIRFSAGGFWPTEWNLYKNNKALYYQRLDEFVKDAEKQEIGLIPSLFWNITCTSDLSGEPRNQWGNLSSKTIAFMRSYTTEIVTRYKDSPAIWGWEFGNEMSNEVDIPYTKVRPEKGTPDTRTAADLISTADMIVALQEFAKVVKSIDPERIILTGHSKARGYAWHLMKSGQWKKDSLFQYKTMVGIQNPDPYPSVSMHLYPTAIGDYFADMPASMRDIIQVTRNEAVRVHKVLFLGEFGAASTLGEDQETARFNELMSAIEELKVPLAAVWVFDYALQDADYNITAANRRKYMIEQIRDLNQRIKIQMQ